MMKVLIFFLFIIIMELECFFIVFKILIYQTIIHNTAILLHFLNF